MIRQFVGSAKGRLAAPRRLIVQSPKAGELLVPMALLVTITVTFACKSLPAHTTHVGLDVIVCP